MNQMKKQQIIISSVIFFLLGIFLLWYLLGIDLALLQKYKDNIATFIDQHYFLAILIYISAYAIISSLPIPGDFILSIAAGYFFGYRAGSLFASSAITLGSGSAFLFYRFVLKYLVPRYYATLIASLTTKHQVYDFLTIFIYRLIPFLPAFALTFGAAALSSMRFYIFLIATWLGILPLTITYVRMGKEFATLNAPQDILLRPIFIGMLIILTLFFVAPRIIRLFTKDT